VTTLRLGISPCPNDVFIFAGILSGAIDTGGLRFAVEYRDVERLNRAAQDGAFDVVKISYANYVRCAARYDLLRCGGALGRGVGPLLLVHGEGFDRDREVLVPGEFTTANFLLDFYLRGGGGDDGGAVVAKRYLPFDVLYEHLRRTPGAQGVVIHEKRFTFARDGLTLVRDLGEYWEAHTGHPIPLGAIAARNDLGIDGRVLEAVIHRSLDWASGHDREAFALCREHAQDLDPAVVRAHIDLYVNGYSRDLGPEGEAAVDHFLALQRKWLGRDP
jgi:1,4-dihydroxy-6-naphthoate synthase